VLVGVGLHAAGAQGARRVVDGGGVGEIEDEKVQVVDGRGRMMGPDDLEVRREAR
jgi:hypothetical protein